MSKKILLFALLLQIIKFGNAQALVDTLYQPFSPFCLGTTINFETVNTDTISCYVYNILGQTVRTFHTNDIMGAGSYYTQLHTDTFPDGIYFVKVQFTYNNIQIREIEKSCSNSIQSISNNNDEIILYPNPADKNLFIQNSQRSNSASVRVFNYTGQLVFENKNFKEEKIETKNLQNGFYVLKYSNGNNYSVKKFLVQH